MHLGAHDGPVAALAFTAWHGMRALVSGAADGTMRIWALGADAQARARALVGAPVVTLALAPRCASVAVGTSAGDIAAYDL